MSIALPAPLPAAMRQRLAAGRRVVLPMPSGGHIVWHGWGQGAPGQAPLVLLHGGSGSWTHWVRNILPLVDAGRAVWAPDLPGCGDSGPPPGSDADALAPALASSLHALWGGQAVDLVGFSFGALTAGLLLAGHPALARRLVLVGAPGLGVPPERPVVLKGWRHLPAHAQPAVHRHNLAALMLHDAARIDALALALHSANVQRDRLPRRRLARTDILARSLRAVPCPVHAIYGEHDALYGEHLAQLPAVLAASAPRFAGLRLIGQAGHWVSYEAPEAFHAALQQALQAA